LHRRAHSNQEFKSGGPHQVTHTHKSTVQITTPAPTYLGQLVRDDDDEKRLSSDGSNLGARTKDPTHTSSYAS